MTSYLDDDLLDIALSQVAKGRPPGEVLASYPLVSGDLGPLLHTAERLEALRLVRLPGTESAAADRNAFLAQVTQLQLAPVSAGLLVRLKGWIVNKIPWISTTESEPQKESRPMFALALKLGLIVTVMASSLGGTLAAAADSLPDSAVYPIKLALEQAQLTLRSDPAGQAEQYLAMAQERVEEMLRLSDKGQAPDDALMTRMQTHMRDAYQEIAQVQDQEMSALLTQARIMAQNNSQELAAAQEQAQEQVRERLTEASGTMNRWQNEAEKGLEDPASFRHQYGPGGPCGDDSCEPPYGEGNGDGDQNHYGPGGPCEGDDCQPPYGDGDGDGVCDNDCDGDQNHYGPGGPCEGDDCQPPYGFGDGVCDNDCDGDQNHYGPGGSCEGDDCQPPYGDGDGDGVCDNDCDGDQNQYGPGGSCEGDDCDTPSGSSNQEQQQSQEQNQGQEDSQNQNQEQNGAGGSDSPDGAESPGGSGGDGGSDSSGGSGSSGGAGDSDSSEGPGDSSGSGGSSGGTGGSGGGGGGSQGG